jgi:hypothetical protein
MKVSTNYCCVMIAGVILTLPPAYSFLSVGFLSMCRSLRLGEGEEKRKARKPG